MSPARYILSETTAVEALVNDWYAYPYTVAPVASSLHLVNYQLKCLESYVADPKTHVTASLNKKMLGGPFVGVPMERAAEVQALLEKTKKVQAPHIKLAHALMEFEGVLNQEAKGQTIEPLYERLPEALRGGVELVYDYYNHPQLRLIEPLLYRGPCYDESLQSLSMFTQTRDDGRAFFMSTPRLPSTEQVRLNIPFSSPRVDQLFALESQPATLEEICEQLGLPGAADRLLPMLTAADQRPPAAAPWAGPGARVRYFGHACVLIEWKGVSILVDPNIAVHPKERGIERLSFRDLPDKIDYVLITHGHADHFLIEILLRLRRRVGCLVVPRNHGLFYGDISLRLLADKLGYKHIVEVEPLDVIPFDDGEIMALPFLGEHGDLAHAKSGYLVRAGRQRVLLGADSNCLDARIYENLRRDVGAIETVFLGMECNGAPLSWQYGSLWSSRPQRQLEKARKLSGCNADAALKLIGAVGAKRFYVYAMGREPWLEYLMALALTEESFQMKEVKKAMEAIAAGSRIEARSLFGQFELVLPG